MADREMKDCLLMVFANKQDLPQGESLPLFFLICGPVLDLGVDCIGRKYWTKDKIRERRERSEPRWMRW